MDDTPTQRIVADESEAATLCLPLPPVEFNRYELVRELGKGGSGVVWLALDRALGAQVALKTLRPEMTSEPSALRELKGEVLINRTLSHPNIVKTFDFVTNGRSSAISMEYVNGTNLHRLKSDRDRGIFEVDEIEKWVLQLCGAMEYAHSRQVVHRDIKPANLIVDEQGDLKVGDFGIGRTMADTCRITRNSSGTPPFMSPQQTMGERAVPSDDIYSIGATVYDLLTGDPPFFRGAIREQTLAKQVPPMAERRKELGRTGKPIPAAWEKAIATALSKEAADRPANAAALRALLAGTPAVTLAPPSRPRPAWGWFAALVAASAVGIGAALFYRRPSPAPAPPTHPSAARVAPLSPAPAAKPPPPAAPAPVPLYRAPLENLVTTAQVSRDESDLLRRALEGQQGDFEKGLADRLVLRRSLSPGEWRNYSALAAPPDPVVARLRPLLTAGEIREKEFSWLAAALTGAKGGAELSLAQRLVDAHELTPAAWRSQTRLYPPPPVDPVVEMVKPYFVSGRIDAAERSWLESVLHGKQTAQERSLAAELLEHKSITVPQWRARTSLAYPATAEALADPSKWPPAIDLPLSPTVGLRLLRVDPGLFHRGTPPGERGRRNNEPRPELVRIEEPFFLGVTELTQGQYAAIMPRNPSYWRGHPDWPIDQVDWQSLCGPGGFLDRLNHNLAQRLGSLLVADIPTSDEWEYACRAGTESTFYQGGPISDLQREPTLDRLANYGHSDSGSPTTVGSYAPNAWGFYDMLGNMAEWCHDRIIRGGSWQSNAAGCRIGWFTQSNEDSDTDPSPTLGFRLALRAKPIEAATR